MEEIIGFHIVQLAGYGCKRDRLTVIWGEPEAAWQEGERSQATQLGLTSMRERAEIVGASFAVESQPGSGTRIWMEKQLREG